MKSVKVKETIKGKKYKHLPATGNISPEIQSIILKSKTKSLSFNAIRIILLLSANLKDRQFRKHKKKQLDLFDKEWFDVNNNIDYSVQLNFKFSDFLPPGSKNHSQVKKGIDELQEFNHTIEFTKIGKNNKERIFKLKSAFISSYIMEEGNGFKMTINNYWFRTLLNITERFNPFLKSIVFNLNHNSLIFYFYLKTLPYIDPKEYQDLVSKIGDLAEKRKGTIISKENLLEIFNSNIKYNSDIKRKLLDPIRKDLNKQADISFNYKIEGDNIKLVTYEVGRVKVEEKLIDYENNRIRGALNYKVKRYKLDEMQAIKLIEIYLIFTYDIVLKASSRNKRLKGLIGDEYITEFYALMRDYIKKNNINLKEVGYNSKDDKEKGEDTKAEMRGALTLKYHKRIKDRDKKSIK